MPEEKQSDKYIFNSALLVMPPPWGVDVPPLSVACLSSFLRSKGFLAGIFDFNITLYNSVPEEYRYLWSMQYGDWWHDQARYPAIRKELDNCIEPLIEKVLGFPQNIIGFSLPTNCPDLILEEIVKRIKEKDPRKIIILGGVSISIKEQREDLLRRIEPFVDYCVLGEGEEALYELLKRITKGKFSEIENLPGVLTKENFYINTQKAQIQDWDKLPFPRFEEFDLKKYTAQGGSLPIEFSRGYIGNCSFCDFKSISPNFKTKSTQHTLAQIKFYLEKYEINHLTIVDPAVNSDIKNLEQICEALVNNNIRLRMSALAIPRKGMDYELLCKMKEAGFYRLEYGVESGSNEVLKAMRKIFTVETAERVIRDTYRAGIKTFVYLIVGYPQETKEYFDETKEFLKRNASYIAMIKSINPLYIMAGSEIFYHSEKYNVVLPSKNSDREWYMGDKNTYDIRRNRVLELKMFVKDAGIAFTEEAESLEFTLDFSEKITSLVLQNTKLVRKRKSIFKWLILIFVSFYTFFYIVYFWIYMHLRNRVLLAGRRK
ncbi:MAG: B12-binding domain-containing radical SAM protein [Candidatus Omnitrophica bacterium]|nr:B12-binding domain-containing radical SAM protein [Candidatus Omnitrophota bacterium]